MSTMKVDSIVSSGGSNTAQINGALAVNTTSLRTELNATGSAPIYACRAWVNFNGTGTVAIRASGNVSSITDNGAGDYTINFTTAMPDANYAVVFGEQTAATGGGQYANAMGIANIAGALTTNSVRMVGNTIDHTIVTASIFR